MKRCCVVLRVWQCVDRVSSCWLGCNVDKGKPEVSGQRPLAVPKVASGHGSETEGVDDILDAVVRTATKKSSDQQPRDRLRARNVDRKSC